MFTVFYNSIKQFIDPKTVSKLIIINGDTSDGSANDMKLKEIIGPNWKDLSGVGKPRQAGISPGYNHEVYWPTVLERVRSLQERERLMTETEAMGTTAPSTKDEDKDSESDSKDYSLSDGSKP